MQELSQLTMQNIKYEGRFADTRTVSPCPFCAAPDWLVMPILAVEEAMKNGATCTNCGRSAKAIFHVDQPGNKQFEIVQTGGDDPPEWFQPRMRRVDQ